jgi:hypothetical protein
MSFRAANYRPNNDFVVTMEPGEEEVRVVSHKTDGDDGYFACFATPRGGGDRTPGRYAFVLDASASTSAPRLEVAKRLVRAMMEKKIEGDRFEVLAHNVEVERSGEVDLRAANDFMDRLRPIGGSDVLKALQAAGDSQVIYIGKGSATFGETETSKILEAVKGRRIRTIAVGSDANGTLLERLGGMMRVNPNDDVTKRVEEIAATLGSPVLSDVKVEALSTGSGQGGEAVYDVVGVRDLFYGERLVVSGRYRGPTAKLVISGSGYRREVDVAFPAKEEGNNYVRRLWAQRKVSDLLAQGPAKKPEVTELGVKYQIMTPYTSFLVLETEQMWKDFQLKREVQKQDEVMGKVRGEGQGKQTTKAKLDEPSPGPTTVVADPAPVEPVKTPAPVRPTNPEPRSGKTTELPDEEATIKRLEPDYSPYMKEALVRHQQLNVELDNAHERGKRAYNQGDYAGAEREYRKIIEMSKWMPKGIEIDARRREAVEMLGRAGRPAELPVGEVRELKWKAVQWENLPATNQFGGLEFALGDKTRWADVPLVSPSAGGSAPFEGFFFFPEDQGVELIDGKAARISDLQRALDHANTQGTKLEADQQVFVRQLEVQLAQIQELTSKVDEHRAKLAKSLNEKSLATAEMDYSRRMVERLQQDLGQLEGRYVEMARDKKHLEEKMNAIAQAGGNVNGAPKKALEAKVTAVANGIELVVISIGKNDGVLEGDEFTVYRGGDFVAKIVIDRSDVKWSAGKVVLKKTDPRVADDVSNHIFVSYPRAVADQLSCMTLSQTLEVVSAGEEGGVSLSRSATASAGQIYSVTRSGKFVAMIRVERVSAGQVEARVWESLAVERILPGDRAVLLSDPKVYFATLPDEVRRDLSSRLNQQAIRAKMELKK